MKKIKSIKPISLMLAIFSVSLCSCATNNTNNLNKCEDELLTASQDINVYQLASFLMNSERHYPISDEFIEKYQQSSGGYIDYAESLGMEVNSLKHLPDQKFHFFDSWYIRSIEDNSLQYTDSAKSRVYVGIKCPELLLWIFEACNASPAKVRNAMKVAEQGKVTKEHISTTAKKMREQVLWEDLHISTENKMANSVKFKESSYQTRVAESINLEAIASPLDTTDKPTWTIAKGNDIIDLKSNNNTYQVTGKKIGEAEVEVKYNKYAIAKTVIKVLEASKPMIIDVPDIIDLDINQTYDLNPKLNIGNGTFKYSGYDTNIITIDNNGAIKAIKNGTSEVVITCNENNKLSKTIKVDVLNHGNQTTPLTINEATSLGNKYCVNDNDIIKTPVYVEGVVANLNKDKTSFALMDKNAANLKLNIENVDGSKLSNNDIVTLKGKLSKLNNKLILNKEVEVTSNIKGDSNIIFELDGFADVYQDGNKLTDNITLKNGSTFTFEVKTTNNRIIKEILINDEQLTLNKDNIYTISIDGNTVIKITTVDPNTPEKYSYDIKYDLGTRKTAKLLETNDEVFNTFITLDNNKLIKSITESNYIYGGGNGGRSTTRWYQGDMIKLGTTKVTGDFTLNLAHKVNKVIIKGYSTSDSAQLRIGDANSTDWTNTLDNKTTLFDCGNMNIANKENVESNNISTIEISFEATSNLKIATAVAGPIYITAIEFYVAK